MKNELTLGSLFDGSGGFPLGGLISDIVPVWASEIEPFPIRVTTKRIPFMKHYGDISKMDGSKIEPVDIITFGSPCTDMSVAEKRAGLEGGQSVLFYEAIRIVKEMRCATNGEYPRYIVWENVPGAFSSNKGEDFKAVLEAIIGIRQENTEVPLPEKGKWPYADCYMGDGWSVAYRTLDAQFWGVPQRRKRIYLVADFRGRGAFDILFKSEGLSRYSKESYSAWQRTAGSIENCSGETGICLNDEGGSRMAVTDGIVATLKAKANHPPCVLESAGFCTEHSAKSYGIGYEEELSPTLRAGAVPAAIAVENHPADSRVKINKDNICQTLAANMGNGGGNVPLILNPEKNEKHTVFGICSKDSNSMKSNNPHSGIYEADTSRTIDANGGNPSCNQGGIAVVCLQGSMIGRDDNNGPQGGGINEDVSFTLNTVDRHAISQPCFGIGRDAFNQGENAKYKPCIEEETQPTLVAKGPGAIAQSYGIEPLYAVRRLTPTECARLQGFPDWWCSNLETEEPTMEDIKYWYDVFETYRKIAGTSSKPKTIKQIIKWLKNPHSDSAEYKMWGNGVALPCVYFVLSGIVWYTQKED